MPNWADTRIVYYGDRSNLERLYKAYEKAFRGGREDWFGEVLRCQGVEIPNQVRGMRSFVRYYELCGDRVIADHDDAWAPDVEGYAAVAAHFGVDFDLFSTEPGSIYAVTTDAEGKFFDAKIVVFTSGDAPFFEWSGQEFRSLEELVECVREKLPNFDAATLEEAEETINAFLKRMGTGHVSVVEVEVLEKPTVQAKIKQR